jgi:hypothetical protein
VKKVFTEVFLGVTTTNVEAVEVYQSCEWTTLIGFSASATIGISARELRAAMLNLGIPRKRQRETTARVGVMIRAARPFLNKKAKSN